MTGYECPFHSRMKKTSPNSNKLHIIYLNKINKKWTTSLAH